MRSGRQLRSRTAILASLAMLAMLPPSAGVPAQVDPRALQVRPLDSVASWPTKAKRWALVIGVDRYMDTQITTLGGSSNDAKAIANALVNYAGFPADQVILLASDQPDERLPTRGNILRRLSNLASVVPRDGLLFLSFAGHGMERSNQAFLLPSDAQVSNDVDLLEQTAINVVQMKDRIRKTGVGQVVLVLDACRNDPVGRANVDNPLTSTYTRGFNFDVRNREVTAFATLYATAVGERAYEYTEKKQGYFTWELVEGLKGAAANDKGEVTLSGLLNYVQKSVPKHVLADLGTGKHQKPFAEIGGYQADQLVIAIAPRSVTPRTSVGGPAAVAETPSLPRFDPAAFEISYWETIKNSTDPEDFKSYLAKYPNGQFVDLARRRSQARSASVTPPTVATTTPTTRSTGTPTDLLSIFKPSAQTNQSPNLALANVFILGYNMGYAEVGAYQNQAGAQLLPVLGYARDSAVSIGVATTQVDYVLNQIRGGAASQSLYQTLVATRQTLEQTFNRNCNCGRASNLLNIFALGGQQGFMEVVAYQNGDPNYMAQIMNSAIQYAAASSLSTSELQDMLRQISSGRPTRDLYQPLVNLRAQIIQATTLGCSC